MTRRAAGTKAHDAGEAWESMISYALDALQAQGRIACWWRQEPPVRVTASGIVRIGKGPPDYVVAAPECTWAVEAKSIRGSRLPWVRLGKPNPKKPGESQGEKLSAWQGQASRRSAILIHYQMPGRTVDVLVPWESVAEAWRVWAEGEAARGDGGLDVDEALSLGWPRWGAALADGGER